MGLDRSTDFWKTSSKCWPKVVWITLGANYAKHYLGIGPVQRYEYHQIYINVLIKYSWLKPFWPYLPIYAHVWPYWPYFTVFSHNLLPYALLTIDIYVTVVNSLQSNN